MPRYLEKKTPKSPSELKTLLRQGIQAFVTDIKKITEIIVRKRIIFDRVVYSDT